MSLPGLFSAVATTEGISVRVQPRYAADQSDPENGHWVWHYHIRIENRSGRGTSRRRRNATGGASSPGAAGGV